MKKAIARGQRQRNRWGQQVGEWRVEAVFPTGSTPPWGHRACRHQRRGRNLPDPDFQTGTRHHSAYGYRDPLPDMRIAQRAPCSPPSACPVRGVRDSQGTTAVRVGQRRGEQESLAVCWGLPAGALPESRDTPPLPPTGREQQRRGVPSYGVAGATASFPGGAGTASSTRVSPKACAWRATALTGRARDGLS